MHRLRGNAQTDQRARLHDRGPAVLRLTTQARLQLSQTRVHRLCEEVGSDGAVGTGRATGEIQALETPLNGRQNGLFRSSAGGRWDGSRRHLMQLVQWVAWTATSQARPLVQATGWPLVWFLRCSARTAVRFKSPFLLCIAYCAAQACTTVCTISTAAAPHSLSEL